MKIIGHSQTIHSLQKLANSSQIPHALIFTGPAGIGKKQVALHLAQTLFCLQDSKPCGNCVACLKIEKCNHPDLFFINPENDLIKIEVIRTLKESLAFKPFEAPRKVAIIADAHCLNVAASNALLKTLEEPPSQTLLILTTSTPHRLLKTILSRCQKFYFSPLSVDEVSEVLRKQGKNLDSQMIHYAQGSPGMALSLSNEAFEILNQSILPALNQQPKDLIKLFSIAEEIASDEDLHRPLLHLLRMTYRDKFVQEAPLENLKKFEAIEETERALNQYANPLLTFENLFLNLSLS